MLCPLQWLRGPCGAIPRRQRGCQTWAVSVHGKPCQAQCTGSWGLEVSEMWGRIPWVFLTTATHVIQHHRVDSEGPSTAPTAPRKKPRAEDKVEPDAESHKKSKKEKKKKKKKHKKHKKKKDKEHKREADSCSSSPSPPRPRHQRHSDFSPCSKRKREHSQDSGRNPSRRRQDRSSDD